MNPMFYFLLALTAVLAVTGSPGEPVLDIHGDIIFDGSYYVLPRISGPGGGGLTLSSRGDDWCPLALSQTGIFRANLNIHMDVKATICGQSTYWYVPPVEPITVIEALFIGAGPKPSNGFFQIKKIEDGLGGYKIVFCVNNNDCSDIGIFVDKQGVRRLALSSTPFEVRFMKATETETSTKPIMSIKTTKVKE
ncbi:BnaAnng20120D [Brassica napus]|uniref:BnaAnng20120D protein n=1 Tax=Brassica napus TaxID=3708 RepID=A0A078JBT6_BRANA|nr:BnaAnng20120D [Brassica napus]